MNWIKLEQLLLKALPARAVTAHPALNHADLCEQALRLAAGLQAQGVTRIAVHLEDAAQLAIALLGAAVYSGYKYRDLFQAADLPVFAIGFVTAFIFAMIAVKGLLKFIASHSYAAFAWYRIVFGLLILATWQFGWVDWAAATS